MKGDNRIRQEALIERMLEAELRGGLNIDSDMIFHDHTGDFLVEVKAHYLGRRTKRLKEPAVE